jgi:hypothetical protein
MKQFCYVVVLSNGSACWTRVLAESAETPRERSWDEDNLGRLLQAGLQAGWRPVRETPMGSAVEIYAYSLVVLEKD